MIDSPEGSADYKGANWRRSFGNDPGNPQLLVAAGGFLLGKMSKIKLSNMMEIYHL